MAISNDVSNLIDNLSVLYDFYVTAKEDNFIKGAEKLHTSPNNLSRKMANLEESLNLRLFNKSNRGISLTLDGERLYNVVDRVFTNLQDFNDKYLSDSNTIEGTITIGTTRNISDILLPKYISMFEKKFPNVQIDVLTDSATNLNEFLISHKIDILIDYLPQINNSVKMDIEVKNIGKFNTCFACSTSFYDREGNKIKCLTDLKKYKLTIPGKSRRRQLLDNLLQEKNIELNPIYRMPDSMLMAELVQKNDFIGYFIEEEIEKYGLKKIDLQEDMPVNRIGLIYAKNGLNIITKKFIELVLENIEN